MPEIVCHGFGEWSLPNNQTVNNTSDQNLPECFAVTIELGVKNQNNNVSLRLMCCTSDYYFDDNNQAMPFLLNRQITVGEFQEMIQKECASFNCEGSIDRVFESLAQHLGATFREI